MIRNVRRELAVLTVEKKKVDVRAVIQLAPPKLAQRQNCKFCLGRTILLPEFRVPMFENIADTNFRHLRKLSSCFFQRRYICELAKSNASHLAAFPKTKGRKTLVCDCVASRSAQVAQHFRIAARRAADLRLAQPQEAVRILCQAPRANAGDGKKMKQGRFAQRKLFDDICEGLGRFGPVFTKLDQDGFDLCRVN